jgi:hypothetical protein
VSVRVTGSLEELETVSEIVPVWLVRPRLRHSDLRAVHVLQAVSEHGAICLAHEIAPNVNPVVRVNPEEITIVGSMVKLAQGQAV